MSRRIFNFVKLRIVRIFPLRRKFYKLHTQFLEEEHEKLLGKFLTNARKTLTNHRHFFITITRMMIAQHTREREREEKTKPT